MVDIALLRALETPDLRLAPGRAVMARVVDQQAGRGQITIAGAKLEAQLPSHLQAGDELRLTVKEVTADRVVLTMSEPPPAGLAAPTAPPPRPDEADESGGDGSGKGEDGETRSLTLRYPAPTLGPVDLRFDLDEDTLRVTVALAPGTPLAAAQAGAAELRAAVTEATNRPVTVSVLPRREPLDVYA